MVFWDAESISDVFKIIGCQGHVILAKVIAIVFKNVAFSFFHALFFKQLPIDMVIQAFLLL
jgi:hypothetical protein